MFSKTARGKENENNLKNNYFYQSNNNFHKKIKNDKIYFTNFHTFLLIFLLMSPTKHLYFYYQQFRSLDIKSAVFSNRSLFLGDIVWLHKLSLTGFIYDSEK